MTWLRRARPALYLLGVALVIATMVGARALTAGNGDAGEGQKTANPAVNGNGKATGPIIMGTVASAEPPIECRLPPILQAGRISEVYVKGRQEVKANDKLYTFDTSIQKCDLERAQAAVAVAKTKVDEAKEGEKQHKKKIEVSKLAKTNAESKEFWYRNLHKVTKNKVEDGLRKSGIQEAEWPAKLEVNEDLYKAGVELTTAVAELKLREIELSALEAADPHVFVFQAEAGVKLAQEEVSKAEKAIELCTVKAQTDGTIERITVSPGATLGIGTREPAMWLIPAGSLIVQGELEAEFAHRVSDSLKGKEVTIYDNFDPTLTYKGTVREIGKTFLPKRNEGLITNETRVLEVEVVVADPAPPNKPPLRVGQRVRVNLGQ